MSTNGDRERERQRQAMYRRDDTRRRFQLAARMTPIQLEYSQILETPDMRRERGLPPYECWCHRCVFAGFHTHPY